MTAFSLELLLNGTQSIQSISDLKKAIRELEDAAVSASQAGNQMLGAQIQAKAGEYRNQLRNIRSEIASYAGQNQVRALTAFNSTMLNGFQSLTSAARAFTGENQILSQGLAKLASTQAIASAAFYAASLQDEAVRAKKLIMSKLQTLASVAEAAALDSHTKATWINIAAQKALNLVMNTNAVVLMITAITTLAAAAVGLYNALRDNHDVSKKLNAEYERMKYLQDQLHAQTTNIVAILRARGEQEEKIFFFQKREAEGQIQLMKIRYAAIEARHKEEESVDSLGEKTLKWIAILTNQEGLYATEQAKRAIERKKEKDQAKTELDNAIAALKALEEGYIKWKDDKEEAAANKAAEEARKRAEEKEKERLALLKAEIDFYNQFVDFEQENAKRIVDINEQMTNDLKKLWKDREKTNKEEKEAREKDVLDFLEEVDRVVQENKDKMYKMWHDQDEIKQNVYATQAALVNGLMDLSTAFMNHNRVVTKEEERTAKRRADIQKVLALAQVATNTGMSVSTAILGATRASDVYAESPAYPFALAANIAVAVGAVMSAVAQVHKIFSTAGYQVAPDQGAVSAPASGAQIGPPTAQATPSVATSGLSGSGGGSGGRMADQGYIPVVLTETEIRKVSKRVQMIEGRNSW